MGINEPVEREFAHIAREPVLLFRILIQFFLPVGQRTRIEPHLALTASFRILENMVLLRNGI